jgi:hypothetical protein
MNVTSRCYDARTGGNGTRFSLSEQEETEITEHHDTPFSLFAPVQKMSLQQIVALPRKVE